MPPGDGERYGSLLMAADHLPRDRHGHPYQVILLLLPGGGTEDLHRDQEGRALAWVRDEQARPMAGPDGEPLTEPVPAVVESGSRTLARSMGGPDVRAHPLVAAWRSDRLLRLWHRARSRSGHPALFRQDGATDLRSMRCHSQRARPAARLTEQSPRLPAFASSCEASGIAGSFATAPPDP
jgi:hypothetical protein